MEKDNTPATFLVAGAGVADYSSTTHHFGAFLQLMGRYFVQSVLPAFFTKATQLCAYPKLPSKQIFAFPSPCKTMFLSFSLNSAYALHVE